MKPTDQQKAIIEFNNNCVVIASPGSGKTFVLAQKIKRNLSVLKDHQGVIAISYTRKASNELKNRSLSKGEHPKSSFFGTIDKFYLSEIIIPFAKHLWGLPSKEFQIIKIDDLVGDEKASFKWFHRNITLEELTNRNIEQFKQYYKDGIIFIETIGVIANYVFTNSLACRNYLKSRYKYLYIDEYQDSGYEQHQIFLKLKSLGIISVAVGDLNQSIYAFSGKSSEFLKSLKDDSEFKNFALNKNHRCHPSIINYSNYLIDQNIQLLNAEEKRVFFYRVNGNEKSIANWIDKTISTIKKHFNIENNNQIAILVRGNRTGEIINDNLNIKHKYFVSNALDTSLNVWSGIFSNLLYYFLDSKHKFIEVIEEFTSYDNLNRNQKSKLLELKKKIDKTDFETINKDLITKTFIAIAKIIAPVTENKESISLLNQVLTNPIELQSYKPALADEIVIMTLHKSKGLEFDVVLHLDLYEWVFPNKRPGPNNDFDNLVYGDWEQDLNLHYVGITRAKEACFLLTSTKRTNSNNEERNGRDSEFLQIKNIDKLRINLNKK
jgi:DNA helicase-2/ATP-dependent DNA helicase PcrA